MYFTDPRPTLLRWLALTGLFISFSIGAHAQQFPQQNGTYGNITAGGSDCSTASRCVSYHFQSPNYSAVAIQLGGTFTATLQFEGSVDNGTTWTALQSWPMPTGTGVTSATGTGTWQAGTSALTDVRVRCSSFSSGPIAVVITATLGSGFAVPDLTSGGVPLTNTTPGALDVTVLPSSTAGSGITRVVSASAESNHVLKASAGNLYGVYVTTGNTAGYLMVFNATSAPGDGAVTPNECLWAPANSTTFLNFNPGPPSTYSTGITAVFSSTGCFTKTASATAFFAGSVK